MGSSIQNHIGKEFGLVYLTGLGTGDSDPDRDLVFYQIRQVIIRTIAGGGFWGHIPAGIGPFNPIVNEKEIHLMPFGMGDLTELKTPCRTIHLIFA